MQNIFDIHDYDEHFLEQFTSQMIPIYDRWNIRPLQNEQKILESGDSEEIDKFINFINEHTQKDYPHPIVIVVGNTEKNNPTKMLNSTMKYFKLKFEKFKGNDIGSPLPFGYGSPAGENNQTVPFQLMGLGQRSPFAQNNMQGMGMSYSDIQGIIDKNVSDATRSIRAEYEENLAKREAESIKRIAELEMKMELYKLDLREKEVSEKERKLREELEEFEERKAEGMETVKDYTKTIAGGLMELGKSALGIEDKEDSKKDKTGSKQKKEKNDDLKGTGSSTIDDEGFTEKNNDIEQDIEPENQEKSKPQQKDSFEILKGIIGELNEEEKMYLVSMLVTDDEHEEQNTDPESDKENEEQLTEKKKEESPTKTGSKASSAMQNNNNQNTEENEDL